MLKSTNWLKDDEEFYENFCIKLLAKNRSSIEV